MTLGYGPVSSIGWCVETRGGATKVQPRSIKDVTTPDVV